MDPSGSPYSGPTGGASVQSCEQCAARNEPVGPWDAGPTKPPAEGGGTT